MSRFPIHALETAPAASRPALAGLTEAFGFTPNIAGAMSGSPVLINCLAAVFQSVHSGSFSEADIQILLLTNAVTNSSQWAVGFHSYFATELGIPTADVDAIRRGDLPVDPRWSVLSKVARTLIETRGHLSSDDIEAFLGVGLDAERLLEVIAVVAASTITNYTGSVTQPPLEAPFDTHQWKRP